MQMKTTDRVVKHQLVDGLDAYGVNDAILPADYLAKVGQTGGATTLAKYGKAHYQRIGKLSAAKRRTKQEADGSA